jgi:hypothetical protein
MALETLHKTELMNIYESTRRRGETGNDSHKFSRLLEQEELYMSYFSNEYLETENLRDTVCSHVERIMFRMMVYIY